MLLDAQAEAAAHERFALIKDYYEARRTAYQQNPATSNYKPLAPGELYFAPDEFSEKLGARDDGEAHALRRAGGRAETVIDCGGTPGRNFAPERNDENANVFQAAVDHIRALQGEGRKIVVAGWSDGSRDRLGAVLAEHGLKNQELVSSLSQALSLRDGRAALAVIGLEAGFVAGDLAVIGEQDILGDRLAPQRRRKKRGQFPGRSRGARRGRSRRPCRSRHRPLHRLEEHRGGGRAA